jgi:phosphatidate cytidylyltransferase
MYSRWLMEPEGMNLSSRIDPYLADLRNLDYHESDQPLMSALLAKRLQSRNRKDPKVLLRQLFLIGRLSQAEQSETIRELSAARREAAADALALLSRASSAIREGKARPDELTAFTAKGWMFRMYGPEAEKAASDLQNAIVDSRLNAVRAQARLLLDKHFPGKGDPAFLEKAAASAPAATATWADAPERPASYHREAALSGSAESQLALGRIHEANGSNKDRANAYGWYLRAAALGRGEAAGPIVRLMRHVPAEEVQRVEREAAWHLAQLAARQPAPQPSAPAAPAPAKKSDFLPRAATAVLLVPSLIGAIHLGGAVFSAMTVALAAVSNYEFGAMLTKGGRPVQRAFGIASGAAVALAPALGLPGAPVIAAVAAVSALIELFRADHSFERAALTVFGAVFFGYLPSYLILVRSLQPFGRALTLWVFASAWVSDTMSYVIGKRIGSHWIGPVSPNKTWEGVAAGLVGSLAVSAGFWALVPHMLPLGAALALGALIGATGQAGGYVNSMIKRATGVKDSGKLFPGHGGAIDRFDSYLFSSIVAYYAFLLLR